MEERLIGAVVRVGDDEDRNNPACEKSVSADYTESTMHIEIYCNLKGRYISIIVEEATSLENWGLCEVQAFAGNCNGGKLTFTDFCLENR